MRAQPVIHALAWATGALFALPVVVYLALVAINWNDQPPSADAERLLAMELERPSLPDAANGYIHMLGLAAAPDVDPVALGSARNARIKALDVRVLAGGTSGLPGEDIDYATARSPGVAALSEACSQASTCIDALDAHPGAIEDWLASEQWLLDRYHRMLDTEGWREPIPGDAYAPLVGLGPALEAQKLHLLAVRKQALASDAAATRDLLERDLVFWRGVLASSDLLVSKMVAAAAVRQHFALGNLALRELPPELVEAAVPPSWRQPLTVAERSLARSLGGEWQVVGASLRTLVPEAQVADPDWRVADRLLYPLFQPQATLNLLAARMVSTGRLSELPYPDVGPAVERLAWSQDGTRLRFRPYNPVGTLVASVSAQSMYANYIAGAADLEGQRRATLLVASLRAAGIQREGAAAAVRDATLRNPYEGAPFEWNADEGSVVFRGLDHGHGGNRYGVLL